MSDLCFCVFLTHESIGMYASTRTASDGTCGWLRCRTYVCFWSSPVPPTVNFHLSECNSYLSSPPALLERLRPLFEILHSVRGQPRPRMNLTVMPSVAPSYIAHPAPLPVLFVSLSLSLFSLLSLSFCPPPPLSFSRCALYVHFVKKRYVRLHFFDEDYLNMQDEVPDELEEGSKATAGFEES